MTKVLRVFFGLFGLLVWSGAAAQGVLSLTQRAPLELEAFSATTNGASVEIAVALTNTSDENRVVGVAVGVVMVDAFNDVIAVEYGRWTDDLSTLAPGESAEVTDSFVETRADELFSSAPFVYAARFEDGQVWKQDLSGIATELLGRFEVAVSSETLQP